MNLTPARENRRIPTIPTGWAEPLHVGSSPTGGTKGRGPEIVEIPTITGPHRIRPHAGLDTFWTRKKSEQALDTLIDARGHAEQILVEQVRVHVQGHRGRLVAQHPL